MELGTFVWYWRKPHVVLNTRWGWVELIRFGDTHKRTFWRPRFLAREFSMGDYRVLLQMLQEKGK